MDVSVLSPITKDESLALAHQQDLSDFHIRILTAAWWLFEHRTPMCARYVARRANERLNAVKRAREELLALHLWPPDRHPELPKDEPPIPVAAEALPIQPRPEYPQNIAATAETPADSARQAISDYDKARRRIFAFKPPFQSAIEQLITTAKGTSV